MLAQARILQLFARQALFCTANHQALRSVSGSVIDEANEELNAVFAPRLNTGTSHQMPDAIDISQPFEQNVPHLDQVPSSENHGEEVGLTHVDATTGKANMVDVVQKQDTVRTAVATGSVQVGPTVFQLLQKNQMSKGDVLTTAQIAGIQAAKQTHCLIPLCHQLLLSKVDVKLQLVPPDTVHISGTAVTRGPTGVEMEALTAVSVAALTVYDMCKAASKDMVIHSIQLQEKHGGKSGSYVRDSSGRH